MKSILDENIQDYLKDKISKCYNVGDYASAIKQAMIVVTEKIREKAEIDSKIDGDKLVSEAFLGEAPRIKIDKYKNQQNKDFTNGIVSILKGMYQGIRNPLAHNNIQETKENADRVIFFISYLLEVLEGADSFNLNKFIHEIVGQRIKIDDFSNEKDRVYWQKEINKIPSYKLKNAFVQTIFEVGKDKFEGQYIGNIKLFLEILETKLQEKDIQEVYEENISKILEEALIDKRILWNLIYSIPSKNWKKIESTIRYRIEKVIFKDLESGMLNKEGTKIVSGYLVTALDWQHYRYFEDKFGLRVIIKTKLVSNDEESKNYAKMMLENKLDYLG